MKGMDSSFSTADLTHGDVVDTIRLVFSLGQTPCLPAYMPACLPACLDERRDCLEDAFVPKHSATKQSSLLLGRLVELGGDGRVGKAAVGSRPARLLCVQREAENRSQPQSTRKAVSAAMLCGGFVRCVGPRRKHHAGSGGAAP